MTQESKTSAAGDIITTPRSLYIDFHNLFRRKMTLADIESVRDYFQKIATAFDPAAQITTEILLAEPVPGDNRSVKLVPAEDVNAGNCAHLAVLRLTFGEAARGKLVKQPHIALAMDLTCRDRKSVTISAVTPALNLASSCYRLYEQLENLQQKGLLNIIQARFAACDGSFQATMNSDRRNSITLRY